MRDLGQMVGGRKLDSELMEQMKRAFPDIADEDFTNKMLLVMRQYEKAALGDTKAFEAVRDTIGEKPTDKVIFTKTIIEATPEELKEAGLMTYDQWEEDYNAVRDRLRKDDKTN